MKNLEEMKIFIGHKTDSVEVVGHKGEPCLPVVTVRFVEHDDWNDSGLARLHQSQNFEGLVERAKPAGEKRERMSVLHEIEFASEKVVEVDQLAVAVDDEIGALLERQSDVQSETHFPS